MRSSMPSAQRSSVPASPLLAGFVLPEGIGKDSAPDASGFSNQDELIPRNPYTVGSTRTPGNGVQNENLHSGAPLKYKPSTQPSTGSDVWLVLLTSLLTVAIGASVMMKKARV